MASCNNEKQRRETSKLIRKLSDGSIAVPEEGPAEEDCITPPKPSLASQMKAQALVEKINASEEDKENTKVEEKVAEAEAVPERYPVVSSEPKKLTTKKASMKVSKIDKQALMLYLAAGVLSVALIAVELM